MTKKTNFESSLVKLEDVVKSLESGDFDLDESIKKYEEGIKLYKSCRSQLKSAEKKITVLTESLEEEEYNAE